MNLRTLLSGLALGAWLGRRTLRRVADWCGGTAALLRALLRSPSDCRETITVGAWHAADPSHLSDGERIGLARRLARIAAIEDEIKEFLADPEVNAWPGTRVMFAARPPLRAPVPGVEPEAPAGTAGCPPAARPKTWSRTERNTSWTTRDPTAGRLGCGR